MKTTKQIIEEVLSEHQDDSDVDLLSIALNIQKEEFLKEVDKFEKENENSLKTEDIINGKIIIADYIKWDKFRELKQKLKDGGVE